MLKSLEDAVVEEAEGVMQIYSMLQPLDNSKRQRLVLVTQTVENTEAAVVTLVAVESKEHAYIQYVDTTGLYRPRRRQSALTKAVVQFYLEHAQKTGVGTISMYASAKPSFVFGGSEAIDEKRPLPPIKLINWWIACLSSLDSNHRCYAYSPFEERSGSRRLARRLPAGWKYGYPYHPAAHFSVIPVFASQDDPKWQHHSCMLASGRDAAEMTVSEFWQTMQLRDEFRQEPSAFFTIQLPQRTLYQDDLIQSEAVCRELCLGEKNCVEFMRSLDWSSREKIAENTKKVVAVLVPSVAELRTRPINAAINSACVDKENHPSAQSNDVQALVKRRRRG